MTLTKILIPKGKSQIAKTELDSPKIIAPDGAELSIYVPQNRGELESAWQVLLDYTKRIAPNPEAALQDLDAIDDVISYHFGRIGYVIFTAVDSNKNPVAIAPAQIAPLYEFARRHPEVKGKAVGFIYQIGHNEQASLNDTNFSVMTKLYDEATKLLSEISKYQGDNWLGTVTEARKEGPELEAIINAGFDVLVPNEFYRPPAVQQGLVKEEKNLTTDDLVLLTRGMPKGPELQLAGAEAYLKFAYCKGQDLSPALKLVRTYFANK